MFRTVGALALFAHLATALTLNPPTGTVTSQGELTITWTAQSSDPVFSIELTNAAFNNAFAIANNVDPALGKITITLPVVPTGPGYTIQAVNIGNINNVYSQTGTFSIAPTSSSAASSSSTGSGSSTSTGTGSSTRSVTTVPTASTSGFGTTVTGASTTRTSSVTSPGGSSTGAASPTTTPFNSAPSFKMNSQVGAFAAVVFSVVAGAAVIIL